MRTYKTNVHYSTNEKDYSYYAIIITTYIEHIATVFHIVCRWEC